MDTQVSTAERNAAILSYLDGQQEKRAADSINNFTRVYMREDGITDKIIPPLTMTNDELDVQYWTDEPVKIVNKEPGQPAAISVSFGGAMPDNWYIRCDRYPVTFQRILSPRFEKDVDELRTYKGIDIRQVLSDNAAKDMLAEKDGRFMTVVNTVVGTTKNGNNLISGVPQYVGVSGGIERATVMDSFTYMPRTPYRLQVASVLLNVVTMHRFMAWGRDEIGGDMSETILRDGWTLTEWNGKKWYVTIKRNLVADEEMYQFAAPEFMGKNFTLEEPVMYLKKEGPMVQWYMYGSFGIAIGHSGGIVRIVFD